jgi:hypothetical protein
MKGRNITNVTLHNSLHSCLVTTIHWDPADSGQSAFAHLHSSNVVRMSVLSSALNIQVHGTTQIMVHRILNFGARGWWAVIFMLWSFYYRWKPPPPSARISTDAGRILSSVRKQWRTFMALPLLGTEHQTSSCSQSLQWLMTERNTKKHCHFQNRIWT